MRRSNRPLFALCMGLLLLLVGTGVIDSLYPGRLDNTLATVVIITGALIIGYIVSKVGR